MGRGGGAPGGLAALDSRRAASHCRRLESDMKYLPLIFAGLWRRPMRTVFTFLSIVVAFILFGVLTGLDAGFDHTLKVSRLDRLFVDPRFGGLLPLADVDEIARVPGVKVVAPRRVLVGY